MALPRRPHFHAHENKFIIPSLCFLLILGNALRSFNPEGAHPVSLIGGKTLILYDAASGTIPGQPLMNFTDLPPGAAQPVYSDGATVLDTTKLDHDTYAGWTSFEGTTPGFPSLDPAEGFQLNFALQIETESHTSNDRSGFSLILLDKDARGIELAFWEDEIWAQSDRNTGGLFKHGEGFFFQTTTGLVDYLLTVKGDTYILSANAQPILNGPLRDYSEFDGFPDPYQTPNFLFLGDDTSSAQARVRLRFVSITGTQPVIPTATSTSTGNPLPAPTPLFTATPLPPPTPTDKVSVSCPSGLLLLAAVVINIAIRKNVRSETQPAAKSRP